MSNFTELDNFKPLYLLDEYNNLRKNKKIFYYDEDFPDQICINATKDNPTSIHEGRGSLFFDWDKSYYDKEQEKMIVPERKKKLKEQDFDRIAEPFKGTLFEEAYNMITSTYNVGRVRIMNSMPKTCLTWHTDNTERIHLPIKTQEGCLMIIEDEVKHLKVGEWYWTNTKVKHTALNASKENRIHLVATCLG
tara:strand:+ start:2027 stop:2602 length:576 start_codon:yes stop_codon:yes gene_type:complete